MRETASRHRISAAWVNIYMSYKLQTRLYDVLDLDQLADIRSWVMDVANTSILIEQKYTDTSSWTVSVTDCVEPEVMRTDHYQQFESGFGSAVAQRVGE